MYSVRKIQEQEQEQEQQSPPGLLDETTIYDAPLQWTFLANGRVTDYSDSADNNVDNVSSKQQFVQDQDGNLSLIQKEETTAMMSYSNRSNNPNEPVVTYSSKEPNYPINYSCEHTLSKSNNSSNNNNSDASAGSVMMITHSYSADNNDDDPHSYSADEKDVVAVVLNEIIVPITLEFQIPSSTQKAMDTFNSNSIEMIENNIEGLQWSILEEVAKRSGLSSSSSLSLTTGNGSGNGGGCNIDIQYDESNNSNSNSNNNNRRTLLSSSSSSSSLRLRRNGSGSSISSSNKNEQQPSSLPSSSSNNNNNININNDNDRASTRRNTRSLLSISSLPYPTSVYAIGTTTATTTDSSYSPTTATTSKWTDTCISEQNQQQQQQQQQSDDDDVSCYTTQINMNIKYRGSTSESNIIADFIQSIVHNQIALDSKQLYTNDIISLKYISNYDSSIIVFTNGNGNNNNNNNNCNGK
jgi:hypothetical protein